LIVIQPVSILFIVCFESTGDSQEVAACMHVPLDPALVDSCRQFSERLLLDSFCVTISIRLASIGSGQPTNGSKPVQGNRTNELRLIAFASIVAILTSACAGGDGGSSSGNDDVTTPVEPTSPTMAKEVLISELMIDPALPVNLGEWFEIHNPGVNKLNLRDCVFMDARSGNFIINTDLIIESGGYKTFATSNSPDHVFVPDVIYDRIALTLNKQADILTLSCNGIAIDSRNYTFTNRRQSSALSDNGNGIWCDTVANIYIYNLGSDKGTPGTANRDC
jgi:hypothetical protein